jgi:chemotaxis protein methyltransferase CheR
VTTPLGNSEQTDDFLEKMAFQKVKKLLKENAGLICDGYRDEYLKRRFEVRLRATECMNYRRYVVYLNKHPEEYTRLLNDLAINYTQFFRDPDVYEYLERVLLPKLFASSGTVRIWSAGCASGEEPYSLAILTHKLLGDAAFSHPVKIYASDIDKDALAKAEKGEYQKIQLKSVPEALVQKYFTQEGNVCTAREAIRKLIRFERFDLNQPALHKNLDLILCRNVMIYFSKEGQQHIHMNFYEALRGGGYFITGKAEIMSGEPSRRFQTVDLKCRVYLKPKESGVTVGLVKEPIPATVKQPRI